MYAQVGKKDTKSKSVANSVTQKSKNSKQGVGLVDNRPRSIIQKKADLAKRKKHKKKLKAVSGMLTTAMAKRGNQNGTEEEIKAHDAVLHAGQHHRMRQVKLKQLITDINDKINDHTKNNLRDNDLLGVEQKAGRGDGDVAIQL